MAELTIDPKTTAIVMHGIQKDFMTNTAPSVVAVQNMFKEQDSIAKIKKIIGEAHRIGLPVCMVAHLKRAETEPPAIQTDVNYRVMFMLEGTPGADFIDELKPISDDHVIYKRRLSAFYNTDLELRLRCLGTKTCIFMGHQSEVSIVLSAGDARARDMDVIVVRDCCASRSKEDADYFMNKYFPTVGKVVTAEELLGAMLKVPSKSK